MYIPLPNYPALRRTEDGEFSQFGKVIDNNSAYEKDDEMDITIHTAAIGAQRI